MQTSITIKKNASGETYGNNLQAKQLGYEAELVLAVGEDGTTGYVRTSDLNGEVPSSPEEAYALQEERSEKGDTERYIPLYKNDGETIIGRFKINFDPTDTPVNSTYSVSAKNQYSYSNPHNIDTPGFSYSGYSGIIDIFGGVEGKTLIKTRNNVSVPVGYMGVKVRIYRAKDGALVRESDWYYNKQQVNSFEKTARYIVGGRNEYYSEGLTREWNRDISQYWTHQMLKTPYVET